MQVKLYNQTGEEIGNAELPEALFGVRLNKNILHDAVVAQNANARHAIAHTKDRSEVRGGGKKPWRQKGTGRARHASIRSPIWKGGGVAFGPTKDRNFSQKINKKTMRKALAMALSSKVKDKGFLMLDSLAFPEPKTKNAVSVISSLLPHISNARWSKKLHDKVLFVTPAKDRNVERAMRNIQRASVISADSLNVRDILSNKCLIITRESLPVMQRYAISK